MFANFSQAYPADLCGNPPVDARKLTTFSMEKFGISLPNELLSFWEKMGSGYFGDRLIYFFGDGGHPAPRSSFQEWNTKDFWKYVYPPVDQGGPVFFAETCFGDQLGFRLERGEFKFILFVVDTFEAFRVAENGIDLFVNLLASPNALVDAERYSAVRESLGPIGDGMHYAPLVSPLIGGSGNVGNMCLEPADLHCRTAIMAYKALNQA